MKRKNYKKVFMSKIKKEKYKDLYSYFNMISILYDMFDIYNNEEDKEDFYFISSMNIYQLMTMFDKIVDMGIDNDLAEKMSEPKVFKLMVQMYIRMFDYKN